MTISSHEKQRVKTQSCNQERPHSKQILNKSLLEMPPPSWWLEMCRPRVGRMKAQIPSSAVIMSLTLAVEFSQHLHVRAELERGKLQDGKPEEQELEKDTKKSRR
mmetsp:Transcript_144700/g.266843  ORF Transcript_144700/g.266843 Transcript_144700/m.266843 type:complete len:105 (+) Transcript_144700:127-441(+)